jgi:hypothetical protein
LELDNLLINSVRYLALDAVKENSSRPREWLIGQDTVNTGPVETLGAYRDHCEAEGRLEEDSEESNRMLQLLQQLGIDVKSTRSPNRRRHRGIWEESHESEPPCRKASRIIDAG